MAPPADAETGDGGCLQHSQHAMQPCGKCNRPFDLTAALDSTYGRVLCKVDRGMVGADGGADAEGGGGVGGDADDGGFAAGGGNVGPQPLCRECVGETLLYQLVAKRAVSGAAAGHGNDKCWSWC